MNNALHGREAWRGPCERDRGRQGRRGGRPSPTFVSIDENYRYNRERIIALDNLRHDYVHHGGLGVRLLQGEDDLSFLRGTDMFLAMLVCQRFRLRPQPKPIIDFLVRVLVHGR